MVIVVLGGLVVIDVSLAAFRSRFGPVDSALSCTFHTQTCNNSLPSQMRHETRPPAPSGIPESRLISKNLR